MFMGEPEIQLDFKQRKSQRMKTKQFKKLVTYFICNFHAVRFFQFSNCVLHKVREKHIDRIVCHILKVVIGWIHDEAPEQVGPCQVVHSLLFGTNGAGNYLGIQMVW